MYNLEIIRIKVRIQRAREREGEGSRRERERSDMEADKTANKAGEKRLVESRMLGE